MLDYDLKLPFTLKKLRKNSVSLALAPSSGKVSDKQAFGEVMPEDADVWRCAFVTT